MHTRTTFLSTLLGLALLYPPLAQAAPPAQPSTASQADSHQERDLEQLVSQSRTVIPGQRIIFAPTPVKFRARLAAMPAPQKTEYLMAALATMQVSAPPKVSQRIGLDYGGQKALAAYIDEPTAARLVQQAKLNQTLTFYAFHVYNNNYGPALLITAFAP